ncbi:hypothetical protein F4680DRAFT_402400 [Xylaria scruposa]|nr:hypothetical protein F4680DRAFT_402400 [Xylaria scruposa]
MKFLADHSQTGKLLERWADSKELVIAAHYFWSAGTTMQKSQQGLLQSLLFDIFMNCPKSIPIVCPIRWGDARHDKSLSSSKPWTTNELSNTLRALAVAENMSLKFCFFIDGLDEYEDDHIELCNVLRDVSRSSNIKICLSSRPWVVFEDSFSVDNMKKLYMHDLTRDDIEVFAREQLQTHPRWAITYAEIGEKEKHDLIEQVAERAEGVFLWAFLVVRSLREGLSNDDTIADMWRRLESLPKDLQRLFKHMLDSVDVIYHHKMAGALRVAIHAFEPIQAEIYWHLEKEFEEQDYAIKCPISVPSATQSSRRLDQIRRRINARTKGLLETRNNRVEFLHRTVRDFLFTAEMSDYLASKLNSNFNAYSSITKSYLAFLKTTSYMNLRSPSVMRLEPGQNGGLFIGHLNQALLYAAEAMTTMAPDFEDTIKILDEYENSVVKMVRNSHINIGGALGSCDPRIVFREEVVRHQLFPYIRRKVQEEPEYFCILQYSPLYAALTPMTLASGESPLPAPEMLEFLLERENDHDKVCTKTKKFDIYSSLAFFMHRHRLNRVQSYPTARPNKRLGHVLEKGFFDLLLSRDADPDVLIYNRDSTVFCNFFICILRMFEKFEESLCNLDAFLRAQPSLSSIPVKRHGISDTVSHSVYQPPLGTKEINSPLAQIIEFLQDKSEWPSNLETLEFWCKALGRLIRYALNQHEDLTPLASALRKSDPPNQEQPVARLLELIEGGDHNPTTHKRTRDSSSEEIDGGESAAYQRRNREGASQCSKRRKRSDKLE